MGKSEKKKRRREKLRLQRQSLSSTASVLSPLPSQESTDTCDTQRSPSDGPNDTAVHHARSSAVLADKTPYKDKTFGSTASRTRALPTVSFVFPKSTNHTSPTPYKFGAALHLDSNQSNRDVDSDHAGQPNRSSNNVNQSIDDILYPKAAAQTVEPNERDGKPTKPNRRDIPKSSPLQRASSDTIANDSGAASSARRARSNSDVSLRSVESESGSTRSPYLSGISVEEAVRDKVGLRPRSNSTDGELKLPRRGLCDERKVLETCKWSNNGISWNVPPKGFNNLGNTCFLNSTLQCLAYCPPFCQSIMSMVLDGTNSTGSVKQVNQGKRITIMLGALFRQVHSSTSNGKNGSFGGSRAISPSSIVRAMPTLGSHRTSGYKFRPGRQEDGHEFLVHLLDAMNDGELREAGINAQKSGWRDRLPVPRLDETTFIHRIFGGYLRSQVRCTACGYSSNTYDPFLDLSLEISRNSCHSVAAAIAEFTRKETLDSENRWKCSGCKKRVCATKQLTVFRPPLSMCIQLKRFSYGGFGGGFRGQRGGKKISKQIEFPSQLNLPLSDGRSCGYFLTGIVIHVGGTASSGHYTAYVKRPGKNGEDKWYHLDDSFVQSVSEQDVLRQRDAYMLMYCRKEVKVSFPTPPLRTSMTAKEAQELSRSRSQARNELANSKTPATVASSQAPKAKEDSREAKTLPESSVKRGKPATSIGQPVLASTMNGAQVQSRVKPATSIGPPVLASTVNGAQVQSSVSTPATVADKAKSPPFKPTAIAIESETTVDGSGMPALNLSAPSTDAVRDEEAQSSPDKKSRSAVKGKVTRITLDRKEGGKVEVMMGPRFKAKKPWQPKSGDGKKDEGFALLGNARVSKWDGSDDENEGSNGHSSARRSSETLEARSKVVKEIEREDQDRKRRMHLDRHDSMLDQGKTKKMKQNKAASPHVSVSPRDNIFQRIQESVRILNKGRAKGHIHSLKLKSNKNPGR